MHANQLHPIDPLDAALWLSVAGVALYTAVELRRRGAEWIGRKRRERYLSDQHRLRKVAMLRARLEEAAELAGWNDPANPVARELERHRRLDAVLAQLGDHEAEMNLNIYAALSRDNSKKVFG